MKNKVDYSLIESRKFDGSSDILTVIVAVTVPTIVAIKNIVVESIRSRKNIKIKHKNIELTGLSEDAAIKIIEELTKDN